MKGKDDTAFLLRDLEEHGYQASWDWTADHRFAVYLGDMEAAEWLEWAIHSDMVLPYLIMVVREKCDHIKRRRLHALRNLIHNGLAGSNWDGMGERGVHDFGVNRTRVYFLAGHEPRPCR